MQCSLAQPNNNLHCFKATGIFRPMGWFFPIILCLFFVLEAIDCCPTPSCHSDLCHSDLQFFWGKLL
jgi:hypothetical protein